MLACLLLEFNNKLLCMTAGQFVLVVHGMRSCSEFCKYYCLDNMSDGRAWGFELTSLKLKTLVWPLDTVLLFNLSLEPVSYCFFVLHRINTHVGFVDLQDLCKDFHGH